MYLLDRVTNLKPPSVPLQPVRSLKLQALILGLISVPSVRVLLYKAHKKIIPKELIFGCIVSKPEAVDVVDSDCHILLFRVRSTRFLRGWT